MTDLAGYYDTSYPPSLWAPVATPPTLISIAPATGVISSNVTITCTGTNFTNTSVVKANGTSLVTTYVSPTSVTATYATPAAPGTAQITVSDSDGTSAARTFTITAAEEEPVSFAAIPVNPPEEPTE